MVARFLISTLVLILHCLFAGTPMPAAAANSETVPKTVEIGILVTNVYEISLAHSTYRVTFWVSVHYPEGAFDLDKGLEVIEARDLKRLASYGSVMPDGTRYHAIKFEATINQPWNIELFPFDQQVLRFNLESVGVETDQLVFVVNEKNTYWDPHAVVPGWEFVGMRATAGTVDYVVDFDGQNGPHSRYPRVTVELTLQRQGMRDLVADFLGFYVAKVLAATTLAIQASAPARASIPVIGRLNLVVGALFGAVGNAYIVDNLLPSSATFSLPDVIEIGTFLDIAIGLASVIGAETLVTMGYPGAATAVTRSALLVYAAAQLGMIKLFQANLSGPYLSR